MGTKHRVAGIAALIGMSASLLLTGCGSSAGAATKGTVSIVAAENQYGDVASQIGGKYVSVTSIESNPNADPHSYEVSPSVAGAVSSAGILIENGLGYDGYMSKLESAASGTRRYVIDVQRLLRLPDSTPNPHLWYKPSTMPLVAKALVADLSRLQPAHLVYFRSNK